MTASLHANGAIRAIFFAAWILALAGAVFAAGCVHRVELRQGDRRVVQNAAELSAGMSQSEVEELLGLPQTESPFRADRWIYVYKRREPGFFGDTGSFVLRINFENKRVRDFEVLREGEFPEFEAETAAAEAEESDEAAEAEESEESDSADETESDSGSDSDSDSEVESDAESESDSDAESDADADAEKGEAI